MPSTTRVGAPCVAATLALFVASASAAAAPKRISGKLSKPGYTVIALAANGKATSVHPKRREFKLRPPAKRVTLHLRAADGTYAGPIVVGKEKKGTRAILGVKAGTKLGKVTVKKPQGYAKPKRRLPKRFVDAKRNARAKKGVPIGAGRFGRVRSRHTRGGALGDRDLDGIANPLDIDDDGDLILDNFERSNAARASQEANDIAFNSILDLFIHRTVNANAAAVTVRDIDAALTEFGVLQIPVPEVGSAELDCGARVPAGLPYCAPAGTGTVFTGPFDGQSFPKCCDPDNDGFGSVESSPGSFGIDFFLAHGAETDQIGTGDVLIERVTNGGQESQLPAALQLVLATVPALVSYDDGAGNSATVSYPVAPPGEAPGTGGPGTESNPFPVSEGSDGNLDLMLAFWRPQRKPIPPETAQWFDIGGLSYQVALGYTPELPPPWDFAHKGCPQSTLSTSDPNLAVGSPPAGGPLLGGWFTDLAEDQPASPANTLAYSVNVTQCIAALNDELHSLGVSESISWEPGETQGFSFPASNFNDHAQQHVFFKRP